MVSPLGFALLSLLARQESTGYDLAQAMRRQVSLFWSANHSQIYPELARLEGAGLIRHRVIDGAGPRPTKRYAATSAGLDALRAFVVADPAPGPVRDLETLRLWSLWLLDPQAARELIRQVRATYVARLAEYEEVLAAVKAEPGSDRPDAPAFASRVTLEGGIRVTGANLDWCDWLLGELAAQGSGEGLVEVRDEVSR